MKSVVSEIKISENNNFKINLRMRPIATIKPLSSNFTKTELINRHFNKGST